MSDDFCYIRNRISEYRKADLLHFSFQVLEKYQQNKTFPIWYVFTIIKWTLLYGEKTYPYKALDADRFAKLFKLVSDFNTDHAGKYFRDKNKILKGFQILAYQQFYLQNTLHSVNLQMQFILYIKLSNDKNQVEESFRNITGLSVKSFLRILKLFYCIININEFYPERKFYGYFDEDALQSISDLTNGYELKKFIHLLTFDQETATSLALQYKYQIKQVDLQSMEYTFMTLLPFRLAGKSLRLIHESLFNYSGKYFIYDFLKSNDEQFTTEFGKRLEKYVRLGLEEIYVKYKTESQLKKILPNNSSLVDYFIENENIFIECKASEIQAHVAINPEDDVIYQGLKKTFIKAYFSQLAPVAKKISPENENWGIILTYKEYFGGDFPDLFEIGNKYNEDISNVKFLPPENVFIIDLESWDRLIAIIKKEGITLKNILMKIKAANTDPATKKLLIRQHLEDYKIEFLELTYLKEAGQRLVE